MLVPLAVVFLVAPLVELFVIVRAAQAFGVVDTLAALVIISVVGAWLARREGVGVLRRLQATVAQGRVPSAEILDGALILFAGALMLAPGFLSDALALLLLLPPTRAVVRSMVLRRIRAGSRIVTVITAPGWSGGRGRSHGDVVDVDSWEDPGSPGRGRGLGR